MLYSVIGFCLYTLFSYWVVYGGGAAKLEGWLGNFLFGPFFSSVNAEQIRAIVFVIWIFEILALLVSFLY